MHVRGLTGGVDTTSTFGILRRRLDQFFERFVFDIPGRPFGDLVAWKITTELHLEAVERGRSTGAIESDDLSVGLDVVDATEKERGGSPSKTKPSTLHLWAVIWPIGAISFIQYMMSRDSADSSVERARIQEFCWLGRISRPRDDVWPR